MASPHVPDEIAVVREPDGSTRLLVDGVELPYVLSAAHGIGMHLNRQDPVGQVSITLLARTVRVQDNVGQGQDLDAPTDFDG